MKWMKKNLRIDKGADKTHSIFNDIKIILQRLINNIEECLKWLKKYKRFSC